MGVFYSSCHKLRSLQLVQTAKKLDMEAYGITERAGRLIVELGDQTYETKAVVGANGLDPFWEETFTFNVKDPQTEKFKATLFFGDVQVGLTAEYGMGDLVRNKLKYRGMAVPGGKVDLMLRPLDFGPEEEEEEDDMTFLDMLG